MLLIYVVVRHNIIMLGSQSAFWTCEFDSHLVQFIFISQRYWELLISPFLKWRKLIPTVIRTTRSSCWTSTVPVSVQAYIDISSTVMRYGSRGLKGGVSMARTPNCLQILLWCNCIDFRVPILIFFSIP